MTVRVSLEVTGGGSGSRVWKYLSLTDSQLQPSDGPGAMGLLISHKREHGRCQPILCVGTSLLVIVSMAQPIFYR